MRYPSLEQAVFEVDPAVVINCVGVSFGRGLKFFLSRSSKLYKSNVKFVKELAYICKDSGVKRLIHLSSMRVFEGSAISTNGPHPREVDPVTTYAFSKVLGERALLSVLDGSFCQPVILRVPLLIGPGRKNIFEKLKMLRLVDIPSGMSRGKSRLTLNLWNLTAVIDFLCDVESSHDMCLQPIGFFDPVPISTLDLLTLHREQRVEVKTRWLLVHRVYAKFLIVCLDFFWPGIWTPVSNDEWCEKIMKLSARDGLEKTLLVEAGLRHANPNI